MKALAARVCLNLAGSRRRRALEFLASQSELRRREAPTKRTLSSHQRRSWRISRESADSASPALRKGYRNERGTGLDTEGGVHR